MKMNKRMLKKKTAFINSFYDEESITNLLNTEKLQKLKNNLNFNYKKVENRIEVSSKFNFKEEIIEESVNMFQKSESLS